MNTNELIKRICEDHGIKLHLMEEIFEDSEKAKNYDSKEYHTGHSGYAHPDLFVGLYDDDQLKLISFFHELGHHLCCVNDLYPEYEDLPYYHYGESLAWRIGLNESLKYDVSFNILEINWAVRQLSTYFKNDHPESTPVKYLKGAVEFAFRDYLRKKNK